MKFAVSAVLALAAVAHSFVLLPQEGLELNGNVNENHAEDVPELIRKFLKKNEPFTLPEVGEQTIIDTDVNIKLTLSNVKLNKVDDLVVMKAESSQYDMSAKFDLVVPSPHLEGDFKVSGTAFTKAVSGSGTFSVDLTNMDQRGVIKLALKNGNIIIRKLDLDYDIDDAKVAFTGIAVEGMTPEQINDFLSKQLLNTLNQNKAQFCEKFAAQIIKDVNALLAGRSLQEIIDWLKNLIPQ